MFKFLISLYVFVILLIAGFAKAETTPLVQLPIHEIQFDGAKDVLIVSGETPLSCIESIRPIMALNPSFEILYLRVVSQQTICANRPSAPKKFTVAIDLKTFFAEYNLSAPLSVRVEIQNSQTESHSFTYTAFPQAPSQFDKIMSGNIVKDASGYYLDTSHGRINVKSQFDLKPFQNKWVRVKGVVPEEFSIGLNAPEIPTYLIIGQLVSL